MTTQKLRNSEDSNPKPSSEFNFKNLTPEQILRKIYTVLSEKAAHQIQTTLDVKTLQELHSILFNYKPKNIDEEQFLLRSHGLLYRECNKEIKISSTGVATLKYPEVDYESMNLMLMSASHVKRIGEYDDDETPLYVYNPEIGIYENSLLKIEQRMRWIQPGISIRGRKETLEALRQDSHFSQPTRNENLSVLKNGIFNSDLKTLQNFNPKFIFTTKTNAIYPSEAEIQLGMIEPVFDNNGKPWTFSQFLNDVTDSNQSVTQLIYQMIQYGLLTNKPKNAFFVLFSEKGRTGKGTLTECVTNLIGVENTGLADFEQIESQFGIGSIYNKALWAANEFDGRYIKTSSNLKNASTGDPISVEIKNKQPFYARCQPLIMQSMNHTPRFGNKMDDSTQNRGRFIGFHKTFINDDNPKVKSEFIVSTALNKWLTYNLLNMPVEPIIDTEESKLLKKEVAKDSNPVLQWHDEVFVNFKGECIPLNLAYRSFESWSVQEKSGLGYKRRTFKKDLELILNDTWEFQERRQPRKLLKEDYMYFLDTTFPSGNLSPNNPSDVIYKPYQQYMQVEAEKNQQIIKRTIIA